MTFYTLRSTKDPKEFTVAKFDADHEVDGIYTLTAKTCSCPAGQRPNCKHRVMLGRFQAEGHIDDGWFFHWDTRMWHPPLAGDLDPIAQPKLDSLTLGETAEDREVKALAPALATESSTSVLASSFHLKRRRLP